jgi:hypothetical protein
MNDYCENCGIEGKRADITLFRGEAKVYDIYLCIDCNVSTAKTGIKAPLNGTP